MRRVLDDNGREVGHTRKMCATFFDRPTGYVWVSCPRHPNDGGIMHDTYADARAAVLQCARLRDRYGSWGEWAPREVAP